MLLCVRQACPHRQSWLKQLRVAVRIIHHLAAHPLPPPAPALWHPCKTQQCPPKLLQNIIGRRTFSSNNTNIMCKLSDPKFLTCVDCRIYSDNLKEVGPLLIKVVMMTLSSSWDCWWFRLDIEVLVVWRHLGSNSGSPTCEFWPGPGPHLIPRKNSRKCSNFTDNWQHMATRAGKLLE